MNFRERGFNEKILNTTQFNEQFQLFQRVTITPNF